MAASKGKRNSKRPYISKDMVLNMGFVVDYAFSVVPLKYIDL